MSDVLFTALGLVLGVVVLCGVFWLAMAPRSSRKSWLAPPSGETDDTGKYWSDGAPPGL